jgi:hypothetical protein
MRNQRRSTALAGFLIGLSIIFIAVLLLLAQYTTTSADSPAQSETTMADGSLILRTEQLVVSAKNGQTQLHVFVRDAEGEAVAGAEVAFTASLGQLEPPIAETDSEGRATTTFQSEDVPGQAQVTVTWNDVSEHAYIQVSESTQNDAPYSISIASVATILERGQQATLTVTVQDAQDTPIGDLPIVLFSSYGEVSTVSAVTDATGVVSTTYTAGQQVGVGRVTALAADSSATMTIRVINKRDDLVNVRESLWLPLVRR